jgi:molecular chaperone DnaK (HSP70)
VRDSIPGLEKLNPLERNQLRLEVELAKIRLSTAEATSIQLPDGNSFRITRQRFEQEIEGLLQESRNPLERCLKELNIGPGSIDALVLVGGTCRIPAVRKFVQDIIKADADPDINPMTAVGEGAAIAAGILSGEITESDFYVCLEHALGTFTYDPATGAREFSTIVRKGTKLPAKAAHEYAPIVPTTESINLQVIEGDPESLQPDFTVLKEWDVQLKTPYEEGSRRAFELEYDYDVDGLLRVRATDIDSGSIILEDDVSYGIATDKRKLKTMSDRAKVAVESGVLDTNASVKLDDPEAAKLLEQARIKVIPFLDEQEAKSLEDASTALEMADKASVPQCKQVLRNLLAPYSYLF